MTVDLNADVGEGTGDEREQKEKGRANPAIGKSGEPAKEHERGREYDTMSGLYAEFIEHEVLPLVEKNYTVKLTKDPEGRATMGNSSGGSAALIMAWYHPEWYHRVLMFSGTFVNQQFRLQKFAKAVPAATGTTDAQGVVYYGRYLPYFDMARVEYLRHLGLGGMRPAAVEFVMRAQSVEYLAPARFDDLLQVFIRTRRIGRTSVTQALAAYRARDGELMCRAEQTLVMIDVSTHRPVPVSEEFRRAVTAFEGTLEADA